MKTKPHIGDLVAERGVTYDFTEITGYLDCTIADKDTAFPNLKTIGGNAYFRDWTGSADGLTTIGRDAYFLGWTGSADKLTTIGGDANFEGWKGSAETLTTIGGDANFEGWKGSAETLTTIGGYANFQDWTGSADKLTTIGGDANFEGWKGSADKLTTIGGYAYFRDWTGSADKLTTIGENAYFRDWTGSAETLTTIGGDADFRGWRGSAETLTTIGGYANFDGWTGSADKLTKIGENAYFRDWTGSAERIRTNMGEAAKTICLESQKSAFAEFGLVLVDGILARLVSKRGSVSRVVVIGQTTQSYIVERDGKTAHGVTLAEARADLLMKLGNRDTTPYKSWTTKTNASLEDMIVAYRIITGACGQGCSHFLAGKNYPAKVSVKFIIGETIGRYGHETFKAFFTK